MGFILMLHSIVRWLVVIVAVVAIARYALALAGKTQPGGLDRGLMTGYTGLLDLNVLLGLIVLIGLGLYSLPQIEHAVGNLIGVVVAHVFAQRARKQTDDKAIARLRLIGVVASILIIVAGVALVNGWQR